MKHENAAERSAFALRPVRRESAQRNAKAFRSPDRTPGVFSHQQRESTMNYSPTEARLIEAMEQMQIVDAHEHLPPEHVRTGMKVDALTLFAHYTRTDLCTAGLSPDDYQRVIDAEQPLDERWQTFRPYLEHIRYGSYARPAFMAAETFYGYDDISDETYRGLSERMQAENTPGIYHRVLRDKCNIRVALTQASRTDYDGDLLVPLMPLDTYANVASPEDVAQKADEVGMQANTLDDYVALTRKGLEKWKSEGAVGIKMTSRPRGVPDRKGAEQLFGQVMGGGRSADALGDPNAIKDFVTHEMLEMAADLELVVAVHSGMWGDFRTLDPKHMIDIFPRHPRTKFDLYHMGMPWVRDTGVIGKNNPNVWLNLCWCHIISQQMTISALDEYIDLVPMNKIIGFGGDYSRPVEKVYGHLVMAREDIAVVLGRRVERGFMSEDEAVSLARKWLYDNPKELYGLDI